MSKKISNKGKAGITILIVALAIFAMCFGALTSFITDYWWFKDLGYTQVFFKKLFTQLKIAIPSFLVITLLAGVYLRSLRSSYLKRVTPGESRTSDVSIRRVTLALSAAVSGVLTYILTSTLWKQILYAANSTSFGETDPVFNLDISFYVFRLALVKSISSCAYIAVFLFIAVTLLYYGYLMTVRKPETETGEQDVYEAEPMPNGNAAAFFQQIFGGNRVGHNVSNEDASEVPRRLLSIAKKQLIVLGVLFLLLMAGTFFIRQFDLLYTDSGTVFGAGFTAMHITMNVYRIEAVLAIVAAVMLVVSIRRKKYRSALMVPVLMIVVGIAGSLGGGAVQSLIVSPNELNRETPYLKNNITYTQKAYELDQVRTEEFNATGTLTAENIEENELTISNIRINDFAPSKQFYNQTQSIRTYYTFNDVDVDRYDIDGLYTQTFLSAREMNSSNLGTDISWLSRHLKYTHGYGLTLSQVDAVTETGQPEMLIDNIPPESDVENLAIKRPEIYYGELTNDYAITNTNEEEFDYPSGEDNKYSTYDSEHGVTLTPLRRLLYAIKENNIRILVSSNITSQSKILYDRNIETRVKKIAPFLSFDADPYIVISDSGQLYWIIDAYTTTRYYPYSDTSQLTSGETINYVRNPIKVTVNAYDGSVDFYRVSEEPIADTIAKIYPGLIKDVSEMPDGLDQHIRYSNTLFDIQAKIYQRYHMSNVSVFYQNEDKWNIATDIYGKEEVEMTPNYYIMRLPDEEKEEFISSITFTPSGKKNMTGLMVARCDTDHYGELVLYRLPKDKVIYGPMQIESQIDQNTEISKEFSLWNSSGSTYTRGDMFVIPIDDSLLYVEPVYLESDTDTSLPEVKRVIVAYKDSIAYGSTLEESLNELFGTAVDDEEENNESSDGSADTGTAATAGQSLPELAAQASAAYEKAEAALKEGDWEEYGRWQKELKQYLQQMNSLSGDRTGSADEIAFGASDSDDAGSSTNSGSSDSSTASQSTDNAA